MVNLESKVLLLEKHLKEKDLLVEDVRKHLESITAEKSKQESSVGALQVAFNTHN